MNDRHAHRGCLPVLAPAAVWAQAPVSGGDSLLQVLVDSASTPAQHPALARCFRARAAEAKALAEPHQVMAGRIIYSFSVFRAIKSGYVKRLKATVLNPKTLKFVRSDGEEEEVPLEEVIRLGAEEAEFRRSIVTSEETLGTIVDASIRALRALRTETAEDRHKIIASALN